MSWRAQAACAGLLHMFVMAEDTPRRGSNSNRFWAEAREVCKRCPVRVPCLHFALTQVPADDCAMYAGLSPAARQREAFKYRTELLALRERAMAVAS